MPYLGAETRELLAAAFRNLAAGLAAMAAGVIWLSHTANEVKTNWVHQPECALVRIAVDRRRAAAQRPLRCRGTLCEIRVQRAV